MSEISSKAAQKRNNYFTGQESYSWFSAVINKKKEISLFYPLFKNYLKKNTQKFFINREADIWIFKILFSLVFV